MGQTLETAEMAIERITVGGLWVFSEELWVVAYIQGGDVGVILSVHQ